ncbi:hypothetical protein ACQ86N_41665 [Puia sp. P3]|uniref:hypothetical protein n=1 Tax=Puia sp. P3 TaxID=3423952 RepID=UPI003D66B7CE
MNAGNNKKKEIAYKVILLLVGLALFSVRLSERFYFLANKPFVGLNAKHRAHNAIFSCKPGLSQDCYFSPDKRYHSENGYTLFTPAPDQRNWLISCNPEFYEVNEAVIWSCFPVTSLRGPPEV